MKAKITVLGGDGIGPEVTGEAVRVLKAVAARFGHEFEFVDALIGGGRMASALAEGFCRAGLVSPAAIVVFLGFALYCRGQLLL